MQSLWQSLNLELQIFYGVGILALLILIIQLVLSFFGGDADSMDGGFDAHGDGLGVFSIRGVAGFFTGFGWTGAVLLRSGHSLVVAIIGGLIVGLGFMFVIFFMMRSMMRLQSSGTLDYNNAIGEVATVYVTVPADAKAGGQIEVMVQGRLITAEAIYRGASSIAPGSKVQVVEKVGNSTFIVTPLSAALSNPHSSHL